MAHYVWMEEEMEYFYKKSKQIQQPFLTANMLINKNKFSFWQELTIIIAYAHTIA